MQSPDVPLTLPEAAVCNTQLTGRKGQKAKDFHMSFNLLFPIAQTIRKNKW